MSSPRSPSTLLTITIVLLMLYTLPLLESTFAGTGVGHLFVRRTEACVVTLIPAWGDGFEKDI